MTILTFLEVHKLVDIIDWISDEDKKDHHHQINILQENGEGALGYIVTPIKCERCGATHNTICPIGTRYPVECHVCGEMACYMYDKPNPT